MSLKTFLGKIGSWFHNLIKAADYQINRLSPEVHKAFEVGSGIVNLINQNLTADTGHVKELLQSVFGITDGQISSLLGKAAEFANLGVEVTSATTTEDLIDEIQSHLSEVLKKDPPAWEQKSASFAKVIAHAFAPEGTGTGVFEMLMNTFYHLYVKK